MVSSPVCSCPMTLWTPNMIWTLTLTLKPSPSPTLKPRPAPWLKFCNKLLIFRKLNWSQSPIKRTILRMPVSTSKPHRLSMNKRCTNATSLIEWFSITMVAGRSQTQNFGLILSQASPWEEALIAAVEMAVIWMKLPLKSMKWMFPKALLLLSKLNWSQSPIKMTTLRMPVSTPRLRKLIMEKRCTKTRSVKE